MLSAKRTKRYANFLGWIGVLCILLAYLGISLGFLAATQPSFQVLNLAGAAGIIVEAYYKKDYQPMVLNIVWSLIALTALLNLFYF